MVTSGQIALVKIKTCLAGSVNMNFAPYLRKFEIDTHVAMAFASRLWSIFAGVATVAIIPLALTKEEQGFYFTFNSILAIQLFFELGLNFVLSQMVSHEVAHLTRAYGSSYPEDSNHTRRLYSLLALVTRIYPVVSGAYLLFAGSAGYLFFMQKGMSASLWMPAWFLLVTFSSINLYLSPYLSMVEGAGYIKDIAYLRLVQSVIGYALFWVMLLCGFGMLATPAILGVASLCSMAWFYKSRNPIILLKSSNSIVNSADISWKEEIFPFQWRIALSWVAGYLSLQIFNPLVFHFQGPVEAGKLGLSLAAYSSVVTLSMSWMNAKVPSIAGLFALNKVDEAKCVFKRTFKSTLVLNGLGCFVLTLLICLARNFGYALGSRFPDTQVLFLIIFIMIGNHIVFSIATFVRANKSEKFTVFSVVIGFLTLLFTYFAAQHGVLYVAATYASLTIFVAVPWAFAIYRRQIKQLI